MVMALVTNIIYAKLDERFLTITSFLDIAKAFNTVNHKILFEKY